MMMASDHSSPRASAPPPVAVKPDFRSGKYRLADAIVLLAGVLLIVAGALSGYNLLRGAVTSHYFFHTAAVLLELAAGVWFISGKGIYYALRAGILLFLVFISVAAFRGWEGRTDCGCFGPVPMNPWITTTLDGLVLVIFLCAASQLPQAVQKARGRPWLASFTALAIISSSIAGRYYLRPAMLHANGRLTGGHGVTLLQPPAWDGRRFPLAAYIPHSSTIMHGRWLAIIYLHTCPVCQHTIAGISRRLEKSPQHHVALLQLPPYGPLPKGVAAANMLRLKVNNSRLWRPPFLPVLVDLNNGQVTRVRSYIPGAWFGF
ncbi:MAG: MauE/DoxX family redox-associated membrane protein [Phycisphaerae bacterium]